MKASPLPVKASPLPVKASPCKGLSIVGVVSVDVDWTRAAKIK